MRSLSGLIAAATVFALASGLNAKPLPVKPRAKTSVTIPAPVAVLPIFTFMGHDTETVYSDSAFKPNCTLNASQCAGPNKNDVASPLKALGKCKFNQVGKTECTNFDGPQVAGRSMKWVQMNYFNGKLFSVYGNAVKYAYADLLSAFTAKYGRPASTTVEKWQAKSGATFDNSVAHWKFKGGDLVLNELGLDLNSCSFEFVSTENSPPPDQPKIDF